MITFDFTDQVALVTGSGRGIGFATARMLLESGAKVMLNDLDQGRLDSAVNNLSAHRQKVATYRADVRNASEVEGMFKTLDEKCGPIDILVNNAADRPVAKVVDMTEDQWDRNIDSILRGTFLSSH